MSIRDNLHQIRERVVRACERAGRRPEEVQIQAVCKGQSCERIREAVACGVAFLGENKVQEGEQHMRELREAPAALAVPFADLTWHFIGKLQKNKINRALAIFRVIESVDGVKALEHIHKRVDDPVEVFIEINVGEEKNKSGFTIDGLKKALNYINHLNKVHVSGLMAIPPFGEEPEASRPHFVRLRELRDEINAQGIGNVQIRHLSMGMSGDYEVAVEEGATIVRIGTALFGRRA